MSRKKRQGVFTLVLPHVKGELLIAQGNKVDDNGDPILKHRLYAFEKNRAFTKIYLNPKK